LSFDGSSQSQKLVLDKSTLVRGGEYLSGYLIGLRATVPKIFHLHGLRRIARKTALPVLGRIEHDGGAARRARPRRANSDESGSSGDSSRKDIGLADERGDKVSGGLFVELARLSLLHDWTVAHDGDPCGHRQSLFLIGRRLADVGCKCLENDIIPLCFPGQVVL
jgi:hypothetical protein